MARTSSILLEKGGSIPTRPHQIFLKKVETREERRLVSDIIIKYHSYVKNPHNRGRIIVYLVYLDGKPIGCIGGGSPPMPPSQCVIDYFAKVTGSYEEASKNLKRRILPHLVNNWKFTLTPDAPRNAGSRVLYVFSRLLKKDWKQKYDTEVKWILTYVGAGKEGTIYKAAGWEYLGMTRGLHRVGPVYRNDEMSRSTAEPRKTVTADPKKVFMKYVGKGGIGLALGGEIHAPQVARALGMEGTSVGE